MLQYSWHFQPEKYFFSKIGLCHILAITILHHCAKNQKKLMMISQKNAKKNGFSGLFPAFLVGKLTFSKIELRHILGIAILHQYAKFHEKMSTTAREIQEIPVFPAKIGCSGDF